MIQTKLITSIGNPEQFQQSINVICATCNIQSIKYQTLLTKEGRVHYSALIVYIVLDIDPAPRNTSADPGNTNGLPTNAEPTKWDVK